MTDILAKIKPQTSFARSSLFSNLYSLFILPLVFAIPHVSYGFLIGLVKFWNRWKDKIGKVPVWSNETTG